ncbi:MAG: polyphosphate kinase 2 family protein [Clostridiaceae bacterium]
MNIDKFRVQEGKKFNLKDFEPAYAGNLSKDQVTEEAIAKNISELVRLQNLLYAHNRYGILVILQAMDAAGKDSVIKHIMSGLNPQGVQVTAFKAPSEKEIDHDYLWRSHDNLPERGNIAIFNRSYYEDVTVVRVHKLLPQQNMPEEIISSDIWQKRYRQIRDFERYMEENGVIVVKFFLHISKKEQKKRILERIEDPQKNWKFTMGDIQERKYWDKYMDTYEDVIRQTSTSYAPWHVIPADHKWYARLLISEILVQILTKLKLHYPELDEAALSEYRKMLMEESD